MSPSEEALERYRAHADICKVLTDPKRLMVLDALRDGERSVGDLAAILGVALPNASQHLAVLRAAGLVDGRRSGTSVIYRLAEPGIIDACDIIDAIVERRLRPGAEHHLRSGAEHPVLSTSPVATSPSR